MRSAIAAGAERVRAVRAGATSARRLLAERKRADLTGGVNLDVDDPILGETLPDLSQTAAITDRWLGRLMLKRSARSTRCTRTTSIGRPPFEGA
jgi:N-acetylmuramoyl-L-alanine amidase